MVDRIKGAVNGL